MKKKILVFTALFTALLLSILLFSGCAKNNAGGTDVYYPSDSGAGAGKEPGTEYSSVVISDANRKIYYTVDYSITSENVPETVSLLKNELLKAGGWEEKVNQSTSGEYRYAELVLRVPTEKLNDFLAEVDKSGTVENKSVSATDITESYALTEQRIKTLQTKRQTYLLELEDETLTRQDIIDIRNAIDKLDEELTYLTETMNNYDSLVNYSTINIRIHNSYKYVPQNGFLTAMESALDVLVFLAQAIVFLIIVGIPISAVALAVIFIVRKYRKKHPKKMREVKYNYYPGGPYGGRGNSANGEIPENSSEADNADK